MLSKSPSLIAPQNISEPVVNKNSKKFKLYEDEKRKMTEVKQPKNIKKTDV
jgi:hypothetical protein